MTSETIARIRVTGNVDDLYGFALLFPEGVYPDLAVQTAITGAKDGPLDRVIDATNTETFVTGVGCMRLLDALTPALAGWTAREIIALLNGCAVLADSNFTPVTPISAELRQGGMTTWMQFGPDGSAPPPRLISSARHASLRALLPTRVDFMRQNPLAAYAASAREFVRTVVSAWLDRECGGRMPRDRVDGPPLRFGLDAR